MRKPTDSTPIVALQLIRSETRSSLWLDLKDQGVTVGEIESLVSSQYPGWVPMLFHCEDIFPDETDEDIFDVRDFWNF